MWLILHLATVRSPFGEQCKISLSNVRPIKCGFYPVVNMVDFINYLFLYGFHSYRKARHYDDMMLWSWYGIKLRYQQLLWPITIQLDIVWLVVMVIAFVSRFWHLDEPHRVM